MVAPWWHLFTIYKDTSVGDWYLPSSSNSHKNPLLQMNSSQSNGDGKELETPTDESQGDEYLHGAPGTWAQRIQSNHAESSILTTDSKGCGKTYSKEFKPKSQSVKGSLLETINPNPPSKGAIESLCSKSIPTVSFLHILTIRDPNCLATTALVKNNGYMVKVVSWDGKC